MSDLIAFILDAWDWLFVQSPVHLWIVGFWAWIIGRYVDALFDVLQ